MEILASGKVPQLRAPRRFRARTGGARAVLAPLLGSFFVGFDDTRVVIALGGLGTGRHLSPFIVLERREIALIEPGGELWAIPDPRGEMQRAEFRLLDLHLTFAHDAALERLVAAGPKLPTGIYPVSLPQPGVLRLVWEGPGIQVRPGLDTAISLLSATVPRAPRRSIDWSTLSDLDFGDQILRLYDAGRFGEALQRVRARDARRDAKA
jgi:hypothetical protein